MKLVTKNGYKFATGVFWQIPDEGKRNINLSKLVKDTKHEMMCQIKTINPTWGFCHKENLQKEKRVASLGKFIVETSRLSASYANSIICYKFKSAGELDEHGVTLSNDLYGYIVLVNGTIYPDEGEYVSEFDAVKESIIQKAKKHEIETLYLPSDVAGKFFSIFELLSNAYHSDELLSYIIQILSSKQQNDLQELIEQIDNKQYFGLMHNIDLILLRKLIKEPEFDKKLKDTQDQNIKYLIPHIYPLTFTSDEVYWTNDKFKANYTKSLIKSIASQKAFKYKIVIMSLVFAGICYFAYSLIAQKEIPLQATINNYKPPVPKAIAIKPQKLIASCLFNNDQYFKDLGTWTFTGIKCNSLGATLNFVSDTESTINTFSQIVGDNKNINLRGKSGTYVQKFTPTMMEPHSIRAIPVDQIINNLQQAAINYKLTLSISDNKSNKFTITSQLSPIFLLDHGILNNVKLSEINMTFDKSSGFYHWVIKGEF